MYVNVMYVLCIKFKSIKYYYDYIEYMYYTFYSYFS